MSDFFLCVGMCALYVLITSATGAMYETLVHSGDEADLLAIAWIAGMILFVVAARCAIRGCV